MGVDTRSPGRRYENPVSLARIFGVVLLLALEVAALALRVSDAQWYGWTHDPNTAPVGLVALGLLCGIASLVAVAVLRSDRVLSILNSPSRRASTTPWVWLGGHLLTFAILLRMTTWLLQGWVTAPAVALWASLALVTLVPAALILLRGESWLQLSGAAGMPVLLGTVIGFAVQVGSADELKLWVPLVRATIVLVRAFLQFFPFDVQFDTATFTLTTPGFAVQINSPCSGYEGIGLIWAFLATYLWFFRHDLRFPHVLLLIPLGTAVIWVTNAVRLTMLIAIGTLWSPAVAMGGFHSNMGSLMFMGVGLGLIVASDRISYFRLDSKVPVRDASPAAPYLVPLMTLIGLRMMSGTVTADFDYLYPLRVIGVAIVLAWYWRAYDRWDWHFSWEPLAIGLLAYGLWIALEPSMSWGAERRMPLALQSLAPTWVLIWITFRLVGSVVTVPIAEELAFRNFLPRWIQSSDFERVPAAQFSWISFLVSSLLFGLLHGRWLAGTLAGMLYAFTFYRRGRLSDAIVAHATTNALIAIHVLVGERWTLWS